jgi:stage V sporulation protein G
MELTEVRISLCENRGSRLKAFCSLTFDNTFVIRDVKLIDGNDGLFLAMPSRKLSDHCAGCGEKNHLRARFCNNCGRRLDPERHQHHRNGNSNGPVRLKLHADIAHPINARCRKQIEDRVLDEYSREVERSKQPGYVGHNLDCDDYEAYDDMAAAATDHRPGRPADSTPFRHCNDERQGVPTYRPLHGVGR